MEDSWSSVFWDESFWFPYNRSYGWKDLENKPGANVYFPDLKDIHWALVLGIILIGIRYLIEIIFVVPVAIWLGVPNKTKPTVTPNKELEKAYKSRTKLNKDALKILSKQTDLTERQVEIWFRKRKKVDALTPMQKFRECSWHLVFYTAFFVYGMVYLWQKPYFWKTIECWREWPKQHVGDDVYWHYVMELGFYWGLVLTLFTDNKRKDQWFEPCNRPSSSCEKVGNFLRRKGVWYWFFPGTMDFKEMIIHHFATIVLMYFSWVLNFVRVGTLTLVVHDAADTWLALAKMSIYAKNKTATDVFFGIFLVVWVLSRLILYPYVVLYCTTVEPYTMGLMDGTFFAHQFFNFFLYLLLVLHFIWTYMIFRIVYRKMMKGNVEDVRSDSEDSDDDQDIEDDIDTTDHNGTEGKKVNGKLSNGPVKTSSGTNGNVVQNGR